MTTFRARERALAASIIALGVGLACSPMAFADEDGVNSPGVQVDAVPTSDNATLPAVTACSQFAAALDAASDYYGSFADSLEGTTYDDPGVQASNEVGRTALRQAAGAATDAANTPGVDPAIADPMRAWSADATKLLLKMALHIPGDSLNTTATEMNSDAVRAQQACAAAGTHA